MDPVLYRVCGAAFKKRRSLRQHDLRHVKESLLAVINSFFIQREHTSDIDATSMGRRIPTPVEHVERGLP